MKPLLLIALLLASCAHGECRHDAVFCGLIELEQGREVRIAVGPSGPDTWHAQAVSEGRYLRRFGETCVEGRDRFSPWRKMTVREFLDNQWGRHGL